MSSPLLVLIRGLPGSGKSTLARRLAIELADRVVVLDPDEVDSRAEDYIEFSARLPPDVPAEVHTYRYLCEQTRDLLSDGAVVVWNQAFTNRPIFQSLLRTVSSFDWRPTVVVIELYIDAETAFRRVCKRAKAGEHGMARARFEQFVRSYESFSDLGVPTLSLESSSPAPDRLSYLLELVRHARRAEPACNVPKVRSTEHLDVRTAPHHA